MTLDVELLGRSIRLSCEPEKKDDLLNAVELLNEQADEVSGKGKIVGTERIAIMAGLNIAHELLTIKTKGVDLKALRGKIREMEAKIEGVLNEQEKLF